MKFLPDLKKKSIGFYIVCIAVILGLVATVTYLIFGIVSVTFSAGIFICLLIATVMGASVIFYDGLITDFLVFAMIVLFTVALGLLIRNSVGDFTEYLTPVGMYGNAQNMGTRFALAGLIGCGIIIGIVGCFFRREKKTI